MANLAADLGIEEAFGPNKKRKTVQLNKARKEADARQAQVNVRNALSKTTTRTGEHAVAIEDVEKQLVTYNAAENTQIQPHFSLPYNMHQCIHEVCVHEIRRMRRSVALGERQLAARAQLAFVDKVFSI